MRIVALAAAVLILIGPAAPPPSITDCSKPEYRQDHLALCNQTPRTGGGGGGSGGGILGDLLDRIGLGGLL